MFAKFIYLNILVYYNIEILVEKCAHKKFGHFWSTQENWFGSERTLLLRSIRYKTKQTKNEFFFLAYFRYLSIKFEMRKECCEWWELLKELFRCAKQLKNLFVYFLTWYFHFVEWFVAVVVGSHSLFILFTDKPFCLTFFFIFFFFCCAHLPTLPWLSW